MVIVAQFHPRIRQLTPLGYGFGVILLIGVLLVVSNQGAQRWLQIQAYRNSSQRACENIGAYDDCAMGQPTSVAGPHTCMCWWV